MPRTRTGLKYPKKGSQEAYEWADRMQKARAAKKPKTASQKRHKRLYGKEEYGRIW